jgi:hypothetical protein
LRDADPCVYASSKIEYLRQVACAKRIRPPDSAAPEAPLRRARRHRHAHRVPVAHQVDRGAPCRQVGVRHGHRLHRLRGEDRPVAGSSAARAMQSLPKERYQVSTVAPGTGRRLWCIAST